MALISVYSLHNANEFSLNKLIESFFAFDIIIKLTLITEKASESHI